MSTAKELGDMPAYPRNRDGYLDPQAQAYITIKARPGMTIRQAFAMAAMQGILANPKCEGTPNDLATYARSCADSTIAELAKEHP